MSRALIFDVHDALRRVPGTTEPRRLLLDRAVQFLDGLAAGAGADDALKLELAEGYRRLGAVQGSEGTDNLGDTAGARASLAKATRLLDEVRRADPRAQAPLIMAIDTYGDLAQVEPDAAAASRADATRLTLLGELERRNPTDVEVADEPRRRLLGRRHLPRRAERPRRRPPLLRRRGPHLRSDRRRAVCHGRPTGSARTRSRSSGSAPSRWSPARSRTASGTTARPSRWRRSSCGRPRQPPVAVRADLHAVRPRPAGTAPGPARRGHPPVDRGARRPRRGARRRSAGTCGSSARWRRSPYRLGTGPPRRRRRSRRRRRASAKRWRCASGWSPRSPASACGSSTGRGRR